MMPTTGSLNSSVAMINTFGTVRPSRYEPGCWRKTVELRESAPLSAAHFASDASSQPASGSFARVLNGTTSRSRLHWSIHTALETGCGGYSESVGVACALCSPVNPMSASNWSRTCRSRYPREFTIESNSPATRASPLTSLPWTVRPYLSALWQMRISGGRMGPWLDHQQWEAATRHVGRGSCASSAAPLSMGVTTGRAAEGDEVQDLWRE
jgi:hypothetical protein